MAETAPIETRPLYGRRVLIPRGGPWGDALSSALRSQGATTIIAPMINFAITEDREELQAELAKLASGAYDWLTVASATTVDVLAAYRATVPSSTKIAAVGETTATALKAAGYRVDLTPHEENTAAQMVEEWTEATNGVTPLKVLTMRSEQAHPVLTSGLVEMGHDVDQVVAYRTVGVPIDETIILSVLAGEYHSVIISSGSVAEQVAQQIGEIPAHTLTVAVGPRTAADARALGVRIDEVLEDDRPVELVELLVEHALLAQ